MNGRFFRTTIIAIIAANLCGMHADRTAAGDTAELDSPRTGNFSEKEPDGHTLRLISWNIDRGYELEKVAATLKAKQPALCLLQEVDCHAKRTKNRDVARELAQELHYNYAFGVEFQELSQSANDEQPAFHGQATLSKWPIARTRVLRFERQSSWWKPHSVIPNVPFFQRRLGGRIALVTDILIGKKPVVVYNIHLESRSGGAIQTAQLNEILADLKTYPAGTAVIIGGDYNSKYHPVALLHSLEKEGFHSVLGEKIERTHVLIGYLDWIFYRGPWVTERGAVVRGTHASDHDLIEAELAPASTTKDVHTALQ